MTNVKSAGRRGQSLTEVIVACGLIGIVAMLAASAYLSFDRASKEGFDRIEEARLARNFQQLSEQPGLVEDLFMRADAGFASCLRSGACPAQYRALKAAPGIDWPFSGEKIATRYRGLGPDLVEIELRFLNRPLGKPYYAWLTRYDYIQEPARPLQAIACPFPQVIVGVDFASRLPVCRGVGSR